MAAEPLITVTGVGKRFCRRSDRALRYGTQDFVRDLILAKPRDTLRDGEFWALKDANFTVNRGDVIGLLGHNGAGKSTLLKMLAGIYRPSLGSIEVNTHKIAVLDHAAGLNPAQTGRESIFTKLALLGLQMAEITDRIEQIVAIAELQDVIDAAVSTYSTGMRVRLAFAMYSTVDIDVFIIDDSLGVADIRFAQRMQRYWQDFVNAGGTLLLASHEMYLMRSLCNQAMLFDHGRIVASGPIEPVVGEYLLKYLPAATPDRPVPAQAPEAPRPAPSLAQATGDDDGGRDGPATPGLTGPSSAKKPSDRRATFFAGHADFPVQVTAVETDALPSVGADAAQVRGQLTVRMRCMSSVAVPQVIFGFEIIDGLNQVAIHLLGPDDAPYFALAEGANTFEATIASLPLMPGAYRVCVAVLDQGSRAILGMRGFEDEGGMLQVLPDFKNDLLGAISLGALMAAPVIWQVSADGANLAVVAAGQAACNGRTAGLHPEALRVG